MLTDEDKAWRRLGIGGSDARTIAYGDGDAWAKLRAEKVDGVEPEFSADQRLLMAMGNAIEPLCISETSRRLNKQLTPNVQAVNGTDEFFRCTLDAIDEANTPVQCKFHTGDKSIHDLAEFYWPQLQHEMFVTNKDKLHFSVIFGHYGRFEMETVERDQPFLDSYLLKAFQFREYLQTGQLPEGLSASMPKPNVVRGRDHVWPTNDNQISSLAVDWVNNREAAATFNNAVKAIKELVPEDARTAKWTRNGVGILVKVSKSGAKTITHCVEKV
jgi:predicted phage-related endonuclease